MMVVQGKARETVGLRAQRDLGQAVHSPTRNGPRKTSRRWSEGHPQRRHVAQPISIMPPRSSGRSGHLFTNEGVA